MVLGPAVPVVVLAAEAEELGPPAKSASVSHRSGASPQRLPRPRGARRVDGVASKFSRRRTLCENQISDAPRHGARRREPGHVHDFEVRVEHGRRAVWGASRPEAELEEGVAHRRHAPRVSGAEGASGFCDHRRLVRRLTAHTYRIRRFDAHELEGIARGRAAPELRVRVQAHQICSRRTSASSKTPENQKRHMRR